MAKVIMTSSEFVSRLEKIAFRNTYYSNKYPYNLCYIHSDGRTSADCWNLIKAVLNGYNVDNLQVGYFQKDLSNTGDVDGNTLVGKCSDVSADFSKLKNGEPRILYMTGHAGVFVGERTIGGKLYNVIECTGSWERKVLYSWVDPDGWRRHYKGGSKNGRWMKHGKPTPWVDFSDPVPAKKTPEQIAKEVLDGKWGNGEERKQRLTAAGYNYKEVQDIVNILCKKPAYKVEYTVRKGDTLSAIAGRNATTVAAIMKLNPQIKNPNLIFPGQVIRIK